MAYSDEIQSIMCEPSPRGLLNALCSTVGRISAVCSQWDISSRDAFLDFILDHILLKLDTISADDINTLSSFPVFKRHMNTGMSSPLDAYCTLNQPESSPLQIPPRSVRSDTLLGSQFVVLRNDRDRPLYAMLALQEPSGGDFYSIHVIPRLCQGGYTDDMVDKLSVELLQNQAALERERPEIADQLRTCPFIRSVGGTLCRPDQLFDPQAPFISSLLPPDAFPSVHLYQRDGALLASLRSVGLSTTISCSGVLRAAEAIHRDFEASKETLSVGEETNQSGSNDKQNTMQKAIQRAVNLLRYLDSNIDSLLDELLRDNGNGKKVADRTEDEKADDRCYADKSSWASRLRDLIWIPVHTEPPPSCRISGLYPPWSMGNHQHPLAKPSHCVPPDLIWESSTSSRISRSEVQSEPLQRILGWTRPISGRAATQQLLAIRDMFERTISTSDCPPSELRLITDRMKDMCYKVIPRLYASLTSALERDSAVESEIWRRSLMGKAVVWIGGNFVKPDRISFTPLSSINTEPYLYVAKGELLAYRALLLHLGVKEQFGPADLSSLLCNLHSTYGEQALPTEQLDMCMGIIKIILRLVEGKDASAGDAAGEGSEGLVQAASSHPDSDDESATSDELREFPVDSKSEVDEARRQKKIAEIKEELGVVYLPDRQCVLAPASCLSFDDAPWISDQLTRGGGGMRFVHRAVDMKAAVMFGARSLRQQLFSGDEMVCPSATSVHDIIGEDTVADAVGDLVGLADSLGARSVHILYDHRTHPSESLMHPGLAAAQGPSLYVYMEGVELGSEELTQVLMSPVLLHELPAAMALRSGNIEVMGGQDGGEVKYNTVGKRLNAAFAITDCLQVLSGRQFFVFDPCGLFLVGAPDGRKDGSSVGSARTGRGQQYPLVDKENQSVLSRFPDQFSPMMSLSFNGPSSNSVYQDGRVAGTLLRMPLRREASPLSGNMPSIADIKRVLGECPQRLEGSLIFSRALKACSVQHIEQREGQTSLAMEYYTLKLVNATQVQYIRRKIIGDKNWRRGGGLLTAFFKPQPTTADGAYRATIAHKQGIRGTSTNWFGHLDNESSAEASVDMETKRSESESQEVESQREWAVHCLQGADRCRDLALRDPWRRLDLMPFVSIALPVLPPALVQTQISSNRPEFFSRYVYCNGGSLGATPTGLSFHMDGSFVLVSTSVILLAKVTGYLCMW